MTAPIIRNITHPRRPIDWAASPHDFSGDNQLSHQAQEAIQRYVCGTRYITWDGRVYKYGHAIAASEGGKGARNHSGIVNIAQDAAAIAVGDKFITITLGGSDGYDTDGVVGENELAGGFFISHHPTVQIRGITGNTGGDTVAIRVYLDAPITSLDADPYCEIMLNPYLYLEQAAGGTFISYTSVLCVPNNNITALNYFWGQTYGPCWISPGSDWDSIGDTALERDVYFTGDGTVNGAVALSGAVAGNQYAGFIIDETTESNDALPFVMLKISI